MTATSGILLDTCAMIWLANAEPMAKSALIAITNGALADSVFVSPVSAWEIGMLSVARPGRADAVQFLPDPKAWFRRFLAGPGIRTVAFTPEIAIDASHLPGIVHKDPADRLIIATARHHGLPIVTRDRKILDYGGAGFVTTLAC